MQKKYKFLHVLFQILCKDNRVITWRENTAGAFARHRDALFRARHQSTQKVIAASGKKLIKLVKIDATECYRRPRERRKNYEPWATVNTEISGATVQVKATRLSSKKGRQGHSRYWKIGKFKEFDRCTDRHTFLWVKRGVDKTINNDLHSTTNKNITQLLFTNTNTGHIGRGTRL